MGPSGLGEPLQWKKIYGRGTLLTFQAMTAVIQGCPQRTRETTFVEARRTKIIRRPCVRISLMCMFAPYFSCLLIAIEARCP